VTAPHNGRRPRGRRRAPVLAACLAALCAAAPAAAQTAPGASAPTQTPSPAASSRAETVAQATAAPARPAAAPAPTAAPSVSAAIVRGRINVDGRLEETDWAAAPVASDFVQRRPHEGRPATQRTEVRVLYGADALYVGARMFDHPDSITAQLGRRDGRGIISDWVTIALDSYNDQRTAFVFTVNPRGVQQDLQMSNDVNTDADWDAVWEAATQMDSLGWTAELRIPLSQLRFTPGQESWGLNFQRTIARRDEVSLWSPTPPGARGFVSRFGRLTGLSGLTSPQRLQLQPYTMASVLRAPVVSGDPFHGENDLRASFGGNLRYALSSGLTLAATVNPDFGQVEADPSEVNLTAFETFFPEKRPFFLEGKNLFDFRLGDDDALFYSRRIGRAPQGSVPGDAAFRDVPEATTILGAVKVSGRTPSGWSVGLLNATAAGEQGRWIDTDGQTHRQGVEPLTNYGVLRVSRDFGGGRSSLGGILTSANRRLDDDALSFLRSSAYAGGVDGRHRMGDYEVSGWTAGTLVQGSRDAITRAQRASGHYFQRPDASHLSVDTLATSLSGAAAAAMLARIGGNWRWEVEGRMRTPGFDANDVGYTPQADLLGQRVRLTYNRFRPSGILRKWDLTFRESAQWTFGGERTETSLTLQGNVQFTNQWTGYAQLLRRAPSLSVSSLRGGPALRTTGYVRPLVLVTTDPRKRVGGQLFVNARFDDEGGRGLSISNTLDYRPSPRLSLSLSPSISWHSDPAQYVTQLPALQSTHYFVGNIDQRTTSLTGRFAFTFAPTLTLELYAQPYISAGRYSGFRAVDDPRSGAPSRRFRGFSAGEMALDSTGRYRVDLNGDGAVDTSFRNPDFNLKQLNSNAVLRWEYRPGSTLFVVWNQRRSHRLEDGTFDLDRDFGRLVDLNGTHVLLIKLSYWLNL
jgi:hypothetical protein